MFCARRASYSRTSLETNRAIFNQIHLNYHQNIIVPIAWRIVTSPIRPKTPAHIGELTNDPFLSDWKGSLFDNYDKMQTTGTFSQPMLRSQVPSGKAILRSRIAFHVKDGDSTNVYDLYARTCADGSSMCEGIDFTSSYSPVGSIDSIRLIVALAASQGLQLFVLDISNAFQNSIIFDPLERVYITLPSFYLGSGLLPSGLTSLFLPNPLRTLFFNVSNPFKELKMPAIIGISYSLADLLKLV
jgi:hypothetical protein